MSTTMIRPYHADDFDQVKAIGEEIVQDGTVFPFLDTQGVLDYWFASTSRVFVAVHDDAIAGSYVVKPNMPGRGAHVANAGYMVSEARRGLGIGRAMAEHSLIKARELGFRAMQYNYVVASNRTAIALWEKLGFELIGTVAGGFDHPTLGLVGNCIFHRTLTEEE